MTNDEYVIDYSSNGSKECAFNLFFKFLESGVTAAILLLFRRPNGQTYMESNAYRMHYKMKLSRTKYRAVKYVLYPNSKKRYASLSMHLRPLGRHNRRKITSVYHLFQEL